MPDRPDQPGQSAAPASKATDTTSGTRGRVRDGLYGTDGKDSPDGLIDSAEWHFRGDFPAELPYENALTHLGMFVAWSINLQLLAVTPEAEDDAAQVRLRAMTGQDFVQLRLQDRLQQDDLHTNGQQFALAYYRSGRFLADYLTAFRPDYPTPYHVPGDWDHYDQIAPVITAAFFQWRRFQARRWWQFWIRW